MLTETKDAIRESYFIIIVYLRDKNSKIILPFKYEFLDSLLFVFASHSHLFVTTLDAEAQKFHNFTIVNNIDNSQSELLHLS